jgi:hypothetical protein
MTEQDWMNATDPQPMLDFMCRHHKASRRKSGRRQLRLFACACCRQLGDLLTDERSQRAIEVSERHADGQVSKKELAEAQSAAEAAKAVLGAALTGTPDSVSRAAWITSGAAVDVAGSGPVEVVVRLVLSQTGLAARAATGEGTSVTVSGLAALHELYRRQCALVRCIFGNPFRPLPPLPSGLLRWNDGLIKKLARAVYEERSLQGTLDHDRLVVMADALEEAGCTDTNLLGHLRGPGPHVRGCHVVDALLGKQ